MDPLKTISLKDDPSHGEAWVQNQIRSNPDILGIKNLRCRDKERLQDYGRMDLLMESTDADDPTRYEVEVQLGEVDPSHIVRTIEYWDIESKRYPQYEHVAVLIAEEVTGRYFNVLQVLGRQIPLIVLKLEAFDIGGEIQLHFTKVLDRLQYGYDEDNSEQVNRAFWEKQSNSKMMALTDALFDLVKSVDPQVSMNYVKSYVGLMRYNVAKNYCFLCPKKSFVTMVCKVDEDDAMVEQLEEAGVDAAYKSRYRELHLRFSEFPSEEQCALILKVVENAKQGRI